MWKKSDWCGLHLIRDSKFIFVLQAVPTSKGQALADEYGIKFFETVSSYMLVKRMILFPLFFINK